MSRSHTQQTHAAAGQGPTMSSTPDYIIQLGKQCDDLYHAGNFKVSFALADAAYTGGERHPELLWRLASYLWMLFDESTGNKNQVKRYLERAIPLAKKAHEADPTLWQGYEWHAICLGEYVDFLPMKEKIRQAHKTKELLDKAAELVPKSTGEAAAIQHVLGMWCFYVISAGPMEHKLAAAVLGRLHIPIPKCSFEDAETHFLEVAEIESRDRSLATHSLTLHNCLALGNLYAWAKRWEDARMWYAKAAEFPAVTEKAELQVAEAAKKAKSCEGKC